MLANFNVRGQQGMDFLTRGSIIVVFGLVFWLEKKQMPTKKETNSRKKCTFQT